MQHPSPPLRNLSLGRLALPIFFEIFLHYASLMINTYMVARHSNYLVGSMGVGNQIFDLFITIFSFLSIGCSIIIAQALGARKHALAQDALHQSLSLNFLIGLVCGAGIFIFGDVLLALLQTPQDLFIQASYYVKTLALCLTLESLSITLASILRVYNLAHLVTLSSLAMNLISILGNYYVLNHTQLELLGIGLATIIGRIALIIMLVLILIYRAQIRLSVRGFCTFGREVLGKILHIGSFSAGENLLWIVQYTIAFSFVNQLGSVQTSVQTIYFQISLFIMLLGQAISMANEIIIGKLVGAKRLSLAYKHTWRVLKIGFGASLFVALVSFFARDFTMETLDLLPALQSVMLPLFALSIVLETGRSFNVIIVCALRASGDARFPFFSGLVFMFGVSLPLGYVLCFSAGLGIVGVWIGFCADEWLRGLVHAYRWRSKKWQNKSLL